MSNQNRCLVRCNHCGHWQWHAFHFLNNRIPMYWHREEYEFGVRCSECRKTFTAIYRPDVIQEELTLN
ncbi:hypothetical protein IWT25_00736 [Secundilactobacillus pentosiphilus]|uniref:Uncharacterized protein n=1 Tax=Secundilactobacillus pentosiphilus TaxID=1714682 RepID=A0A1Z5IV16_9LACO|nr:hypothetical protein IWT25_00736 [Secundilactobacillus pentosiphilus]